MHNTIWLYIWRFQPFHNGHKSIVDTMLEDNENNLILIGVSPSQSTKENPYSYAKRLWFISEIYKDASWLYISPLIDNPSDKNWIQQILGIWFVQKAGNIRIYCWDKWEDSAIQVIQQYEKLFSWKNLEIIEIDRNIIPVSWTQVRHEMKEAWVESVWKLVPAEVHKQLKNNG